jgi:stage II sporulation protein B
MQPKARMTFRFDPPPAATRKPETDSRSEDLSELEAMIRETGFLASGERQPLPLASIDPPDVAPSRDDKSPGASQTDGGQAEPPPLIEEPIDLFSAGFPVRKQAGTPWWKLFVSAAGAIATGALLGYLVLTLIAGELDGTAPFGAQPAEPAAASLPAASAASPLDTWASPSADSGTAVMEAWPSQTYYWLQYGVFRSGEAMEAAADDLKSQGLPGFADRAEGYRTFAGVAASKAEAEQLAGQMPGKEFYVKPLVLEAVQQEVSAGLEGLGDFEASSHRLARELLGISVSALQDAMPQAIGTDRLQALRDSHSQWLAASDVIARMDERVRTQVEEMAAALQEAMSAVDRYEAKVSRYHLWRIQSEMMRFLAADRTLRSQVRAMSGMGAE